MYYLSIHAIDTTMMHSFPILRTIDSFWTGIGTGVIFEQRIVAGLVVGTIIIMMVTLRYLPAELMSTTACTDSE